MCGRYALYTTPHTLKDLFGLENMLNLPPRYNAAPMQDLPIIVKNRIGMARWGFTPAWGNAADLAMASKMINARSETVAEKPAFRDSWARQRRCLVPANGFYEWCKDTPKGNNQPYYIRHRRDECMAFAGLWSKVDNLVTFAILTRVADGPLAALHKRMPVCLTPDQAQQWFTADEREARALINASSGEDLAFHKVVPDVGKVANDYEALILPYKEKKLSLISQAG